MYDIGLTHIALPVKNPDESITFYAKYVRMQVIHRRPGVVWLTDKTRPFVIVLIEKPAVDQAFSFGHLGVGCESREAVDRLCEVARAEGRLIDEPEDAGPPIGYWAFIRDPDGHTLEVSFGQEIGLTVAQAT